MQSYIPCWLPFVQQPLEEERAGKEKYRKGVVLNEMVGQNEGGVKTNIFLNLADRICNFLPHCSSSQAAVLLLAGKSSPLIWFLLVGAWKKEGEGAKIVLPCNGLSVCATEGYETVLKQAIMSS